MKTKLIPLAGDLPQSFYQLGLGEKEAFLKIEKRINKLLSTNSILRFGQDVISRARLLMKKKELGLFEKCLASYAEGLGIDLIRYQSFLSLFELAAHYGQVYPELKGLLPGCTSVFQKVDQNIIHARLLDFPLIGLFEESPRLYCFQGENGKTILSYSCEGLAPLFFQGIHSSGLSFALHHKPGRSWHQEGQSIFQIAFETLFATEEATDFKKLIKKQVSITKWSFLTLESTGQVNVLDIDGPSLNSANFDLNDSSPLIFTNIPLQHNKQGFDHFIKFSEDRQTWLKEKLKNNKSPYILDAMTDVEDQKIKKWIHPSATLSTVGAYQINLSTGELDLKEGSGALVKSDAIIRFELSTQGQGEILKEAQKISLFEKSWKMASFAQSEFDQGALDQAYHHLQMAIAITPHPIWKEIFSFYLCLWDFKFVSSSKELALIYKRLLKLTPPDNLRDQWKILIMRLEKRLELSPTLSSTDVSPFLRDHLEQEKAASRPVFATWMKLIYPRMEILDVFSPHHK